MTRARAVALAALVAAAAGPAVVYAQPDLDAGVAELDGGTRVLIDGPMMLGIGRPQVSAMAAPSEVRLGDKLTLFVEVTYDEQVTISVPSGLGLQPVFDELKRSSVDERRNDGTRKRTYQIQLQVWDLGDLRIPPIQVTYTVGRDSSWIVTNDVPIRVIGSIDSIDDPNAFLGATPPVGLRRRDWRWIIAGTALAVLGAGALVAWLIARRRRRPLEPTAMIAPSLDVVERADAGRSDGGVPAVQVVPVEARAPAHGPALFVVTHEAAARARRRRRALDALDALERAGTIAADQPAGFRALVAILHTFAVEQYLLAPRHRTSADLIGALRRTVSDRAGVQTTAMPAPAIDATTAWLERCDRVKYGAGLVDDGGARALADARELIVLAAGPRAEAADA